MIELTQLTHPNAPIGTIVGHVNYDHGDHRLARNQAKAKLKLDKRLAEAGASVDAVDPRNAASVSEKDRFLRRQRPAVGRVSMVDAFAAAGM